MDTIDKWLKSLRLHKYTHLFKSLTYDQMLNLEERYLIEREVTKGARNKMLVSVKKLNLRRERLVNMMDDLNQDNISMKEALTLLKDMLITPIPPPPNSINENKSILSSAPSSPPSPFGTSSSLSSINSSSTDAIVTSPTTTTTVDGDQQSNANCIISSTNSKNNDNEEETNMTMSSTTTTPTTATSSINGYSILMPTLDRSNSKTNNYLDPYELTYLFIETLEKVAQRLIESAGYEDNACHGIMAAIVDECLKHNSFTKEQKAKVASFKQHFTKEQKAKVASHRQQLRQRPHSNNHHHYQNQNQFQLQQQQQHIQQRYQHQQHQFHNHNHHYHYFHQHNHWTEPIRPLSLSASLSTIGSASTSDEEERQTYKEYSLLGPGKTFELPCLRALAATEKHNRRQLCFLSVFQSKSSC